jgi:hypothetical protein
MGNDVAGGVVEAPQEAGARPQGEPPGISSPSGGEELRAYSAARPWARQGFPEGAVRFLENRPTG